MERQVRMVVCGLRRLADRVHERKRLGEVRERELPLKRSIDLGPPVSHSNQYAAPPGWVPGIRARCCSIRADTGGQASSATGPHPSPAAL